MGCQGSLWGFLPCTQVGEKLKYHPFWGSPLFYKAPPRQFQPPKCKLTPSKIQTVEGRFLCISIQKLQIGGRQSLFGGCQFTFWRVPIYILEAEIVLGVLYRKGVIPKKGGTLDYQPGMIPTPPLKNADSGQKWGEGGAYIISLWRRSSSGQKPFTVQPP